ncbi:MAG: PAS domain-containing protein [Clostridia bacterium]|nr:PAS domain-containing protein [Clostridia bacterium]
MDRIDPSAAPLEALFRHSPDAVCAVRRGAVVYANAAAERLFGRDVTGESAADLFPGVDLSAPVLAAALTAEGRGRILTAAVWEDLTVYTLRDGERAAPIPPAALSRMRTAAANLRLSLDHLVDPEAEDPYIAALFHSYYSLLHVTEQLADMNALAAGELAAVMKPLPLDALLSELTDSVSLFTAGRGVSIRCRIEDAPCCVTGDRERLEQLVLILLSNSLKRTPPGGGIVLSLRRSGRMFLLSAEDDGPGLSQAELADAFRPGGETDPAAALSGSGLGLYLAQGIARLHGGALVIESREGQGARVSVSLPESPNLCLYDSAAAPGPRRILTELCDILPGSVYLPRYLD